MAASSSQKEPLIKAKSTITSRLRENESKFIQQLEKKDQEIIELRKELNELAEKQAKIARLRSNNPKKRKGEAVVLRALSTEKLHLERQLQIATKSLEALQTAATKDLNLFGDEMLKTIKFKSELCDKMEKQLHLTQSELVKIKAENFKLLKTLAETRGQFEVIEERLLGQSCLVEKVDHLEKILSEWKSSPESGYSSSCSSVKKDVRHMEVMTESNNGVLVVESDLSSYENLSDIQEVTEEDPECSDDNSSAVVAQKNPPRFYMALEDHNAQGQGFLSFSAGQLIQVKNPVEKNGLVIGEIGGTQGCLPRAAITEVQTIEASLATSSSEKYKIALYDYNPREQSPNPDCQMELSFLAGDIFRIYGEMDNDGFYFAELNGKRGLVPSNYVITIPNRQFMQQKYI